MDRRRPHAHPAPTRRLPPTTHQDFALALLSRLGRCGIVSLRIHHAFAETLDQIGTAAAPGWRISEDVWLPEGGNLPIAVFGDERAVIIVPMVGPDYPAAVARADDAAWQLSRRADPSLPITTMACRSDNQEEPRVLPGPSGISVTVTGLPWLPGLMRQQLGYVADDPGLPERLDDAFAAAAWRTKQKHELYLAAVRDLPADRWWAIRDLYLDDGGTDSIDLALVGPSGVFVVKVSMTATPGCVPQVALAAQRLRGYLPQLDVVPVVVTAEPSPRFGPDDWAGYPIPWLPPQRVLDVVQRTQRRGLATPQIRWLNVPAHGWYRRLDHTPGGPQIAYGLTT